MCFSCQNHTCVTKILFIETLCSIWVSVYGKTIISACGSFKFDFFILANREHLLKQHWEHHGSVTLSVEVKQILGGCSTSFGNVSKDMSLILHCWTRLLQSTDITSPCLHTWVGTERIEHRALCYFPPPSVSLWCYCWCRCHKHSFSNMATASRLKALKTTERITAWSSNPDVSAVKRQSKTAGCISWQVLLLSDLVERMLVFNRLKFRLGEETHINEGTDFDTTPDALHWVNTFLYLCLLQ